MGVGSGLGDTFGIGTQVAYPTGVAATRFYQSLSVGLKRNKYSVQGSGSSGGQLVDRGARRVQPKKDASGPVQMEVVDRTMGLLFSHALGVVPAGVAAGPGYLYRFPLTDNVGRYFSSQVGINDTGGTTRGYYYPGCKVASSTFSIDRGGILTAGFDLDARQVTETAPGGSFVSPSYTPGLVPFHFAGFGVTLGGSATAGVVSGGAAASGVKSMTCTIARPQDTDRQYANSSGLKDEPIANDKVSISGSFEVDFVNKADFADRFESDTAVPGKITILGPLIGGSTYAEFTIHLPQLFFDEGAPTYEGPGINTTTVPFTALFDGSNTAVTVDYVTADAAL